MEEITTFAHGTAAQHFLLVAITKSHLAGAFSLPLNVTLTVNGVELPFSETMEEIYRRYEKQAREDVEEQLRLIEHLKTEEGLRQKAKEMAKEMCVKMAEKFDWDE